MPNDLKSRLTHKIGPLPVWAWGGMFGVAGFYVYSKRKAANAAAASDQGSQFTAATDYGQIDPNTGVPYALEGAFSPSPFDSSGGGSSGGGGGFDVGGLLSNLGALLAQPPAGATISTHHPHAPKGNPGYSPAPGGGNHDHHHHHHGPHHGPPVHPTDRVHRHPGANGGATASARFGGRGHGNPTHHTPHAGTDRHGSGLHGGHHPSHRHGGKKRH